MPLVRGSEWHAPKMLSSILPYNATCRSWHQGVVLTLRQQHVKMIFVQRKRAVFARVCGRVYSPLATALARGLWNSSAAYNASRK
jgi:hypothetical protein